MEVLAILALLAFIIGAVIFAVQKAWAHVFVATGLALLTVSDAFPKLFN